MKITTIRLGEDLLLRLNRLKYQWGYKTLDHVIRHLIDIKTPPLTNTNSHQNSGTLPLFYTPDSVESANPIQEEEGE
jgi:hypothetical protein